MENANLKMKREMNVGLYGLGTVGSGVAEILLKKPHIEGGMKFVLKKIFERDTSKFKKLNIPLSMQSSQLEEIIKDPQIDVVIELFGGMNPAKKIILDALEAGKDVVTANKMLMAEEADLIFRKAYEKGRKVGYNASLLGAYPILETLNAFSISGRLIGKISGVLNGTTNYILTEMEKNKSFPESLKTAQKEGYAERDPSLDIKGMDTAHKMCILLFSVYGVPLRINQFPVEGIQNISLEDVKFSKELGYKIRLLATCSYINGAYDIRVCPYLIPCEHMFASFEGVQNGVEVKGFKEGTIIGYSALGAGKYPAAYAVVENLTEIYRENGGHPQFLKSSPLKLINPDNAEFEYYLRFNVADKIGVLAKISSILAKHKISIASVIQKKGEDVNGVPIILVTHRAKEGFIKKALEEIDALPIMKRKTTLIRLFEK